jgi:hypothetical protein
MTSISTWPSDLVRDVIEELALSDGSEPADGLPAPSAICDG